MLVLTRKPTETIVIGEQGEIKIHVIEVNDTQVRLGIDAPKTITVDRLEVFVRKKYQKRLARQPGYQDTQTTFIG